MKTLKSIITVFLVALTVFGFTPIIENALQSAQIVNVAEAKDKIQLNRNKILIAKGESYKLKLKGNKKSVKWSSDNKKIATVKNGLVIGKRKGSATITAKVGKKKYKCKVTVFKRAREGGVWKANINNKAIYFSVSDYTSQSGPYHPYGVVVIGFDNEDNDDDSTYGEYKRIGINKYRYKYGNTVIDFKVKGKTVKVKVIKGDVKGMDISGKYSLVHYPYGG